MNLFRMVDGVGQFYTMKVEKTVDLVGFSVRL